LETAFPQEKALFNWSIGRKVGNPLSYKSLAEDLDVSDKTVKRWVQILDSLYYCYLVPPLGLIKLKL
jgi:predicted AAA+ superfamily ATPase